MRAAPEAGSVKLLSLPYIYSFFQIHNDDGVWLRLSAESIKRWCPAAVGANNGLTEAWALQYNQQLGKTLLVPVDEPKSILDEIIKETILRRLPDLMRDSKGQVRGRNNSQWVTNSIAKRNKKKQD